MPSKGLCAILPSMPSSSRAYDSVECYLQERRLARERQRKRHKIVLIGCHGYILFSFQR
ncbi:hypothetical protein BU25DRAFT_62280 [Macroventuria anomochaeta]|uniref:Uncharacterized protein n=1 Tax=Macroventuria anomochaeta TaxID=301207 RepID=A0ACB6RZP5_9PLEO|nr:uncharacterized protein BU25DRAFT_62280 [Macroventuria anomochaeta]KAF2627371.1 hypothetical protein BU25DRAFT_62280 [Macroventuria anomochaeta]